MTSKTIPIALHYFRLPRHTWELMLTRMRQLGGDAIYTPLPWGFHEFSENKFDLSGLTNPRRDVAAFVRLCETMGFQVILDLIPNPEAKLLNGGFPGWLLRQHPEIQAKNRQGDALAVITLEDPTTLKYIERWLQQVSQALPNTIKIQLDLQNYPLDYNDHIAKVQWPVWLRKRYAEGGIDGLNAAYSPETPYSSFSRIPLTDTLGSPAFQQDVQDFTGDLRDHARQTYSALLQENGRSLAEPTLQPPSHGAQINPDPADVGASFQWAMDAPIRPDGSPRHSFWALKKANLKSVLPDDAPIYVAAPTEQASFQVEANTLIVRLMLNGKLEQTILDADDEATTLSAEDKTGTTDLYFTLSEAEAPLTGYLDGYLRSLLAGKTQTLARCANMVEQLLEALRLRSGQAFERPSLPAENATLPPISEAQAALTEANLALYKAAASIGALEEAFAVALDKPQELETAPPFLTLDAAQLEKVQAACQTVAPILRKASETSLPSPFSVEQYTVAHNGVVDAADQVIEMLVVVLQWLREELTAETLPPTAWTVHAHLQTILQSLSQWNSRF